MLKAFPVMTLAFNNLIKLAVRIASRRTLLRRDLAGKVYHKVVGDWSLRKGLATFFTEIPSAYFLLYLARPKLSRIADFACGSGTLLVADYSAANAECRLSLLKAGIDKHPSEIEKDFHTKFVNFCYAFDVLVYATQVTALNVSLHSPETPIQDFSSIYTMPLGYRKEDESVSLGSLELARVKGKFEQIFGEVTKTGLKKTQKELLSKLLEQLLKGRTAVIIAHRLSTVRNADRIVVLDKGQIIEEGRHQELSARGGLYSRLCEMTFAPAVRVK